MTNADPTRIAPNPSDSVLMTLARAAMKPEATFSETTWPRLDLDDPRQREFGDYELLEEIGRGGMGVVYRARQRSLDRDVAIKFIAAGIADSFNVARFLGEARAAARLLHPNIVPVHEVGSIDGVHYFSMPLIKGRTLASLLDDGTLAPATAIALMLKLCDAIGYAHRLGLLHLDLKPANVLLDERNEPLVTDFGLARHMDAGGGVDAQEVSGTPSFMAPEQILIKQYRLTPATDLYALGAILYRCLAGVSPHGEGLPDELTQRAVAGRVRPLREINPAIPPDLAAIAMKCLELLPKDRYASVADLADDLRRVRDGFPVSVRRIGTLERVLRWVRREPRLAVAVTVAAFAMLAGAAATTWLWREAVVQRDAAAQSALLAKSERDRASIASEIGAHLFAFDGKSDERAANLIQWLRERLPGDEQRQAEALAAFTNSVDGEDRGQAEQLLYKVVEVLGVDYRRQVVEALQSGNDPQRHLYSALLVWSDATRQSPTGARTPGAPGIDRYAELLNQAMAEHPDDPLVLHIAAVFCPERNGVKRCVHPDAVQALVRADPDNMYHWVLLAMSAPEDEGRRTALHEAAQRSVYDDHMGGNYDAYARAFTVAGVPAPPLLSRPVKVLAPEERAESVIGQLSADWSIILPSFQLLTQICGTSAGAVRVVEPTLRSDCLSVGETMMRSHSGLISRMIGVALVRNLAPGSTLAEEGRQLRRLYRYLTEMNATLTPSQRIKYPSGRYVQDIVANGELAALQRMIEFNGLPGTPPDDWAPADPNALLTGPEIFRNQLAADRDSRSLLAQGKYAEAIALLAPIVSAPQGRSNDWLWVRYQTTIGRAFLARNEFEQARAALSRAWDLADGFPPSSSEAIGCAEAMIDLHSRWSASEPGQGHETKMLEWQQILGRLRASDND